MSDKASLRTRLGINPYDGFYYKAISPAGYLFPTSESALAKSIIEKFRPETIIEVGSYLGGSALTMARLCRELGLQSEIVCIDTWQGTLDMWEKPECRKALMTQHGHPRIYRQFLANVCHDSAQDIITPLPMPSSIGLRLLRKLGVTAQFIYIDGSHEYEDALLDIKLAEKILSTDGVMLVDDMDWPDVRMAVSDSGFKITEEKDNQGVLCR